MKFFSLLIIIYFLVKLSALYFSYNKTEDKTVKTVSTEPIKALTFNAELNKSDYIFTDEAWNIQRKKEAPTSQKDVNKTIETPLVLNLTTMPITICDSKECFEFIGFENGHAIFYGTNDINKEGFLQINTDDYLSDQILVTAVNKDKVTFYDLDFNKSLEINMFDLNISKYTPKKQKDTTNETK